MRIRPNEGPMPDPLAYFITWSTYGTWLPGDERGWVEYRHGWKMPDPVKTIEAKAKMTEDACLFDLKQRGLVEDQIAETCHHRGWTLYAVNCRSNHLHMVVATSLSPKRVQSDLKAWSTRRLKADWKDRLKLAVGEESVVAIRENWWAERGSQRFINHQDNLEAVILYVRDGQDLPHRH